MTHRQWYVLAVVVAVIALLAGGRYSQHGSRGADEGRVGGSADAYAQSESKNGLHIPNSAEKVRMTAWMASTSVARQAPAIMVRLAINQGWHVNANPASLRFLIPTTVKARINHQDVKLKLSYPPGRDSHIKLDGKSIFVYDNNTILNAGVPASTLATARSVGSVRLVVTVQSCSDKGICLAPAQLRSTIEAPF